MNLKLFKSHEDEDTISVENLFPGDQSEIYKSGKINYIINELLQTEENYINNLRRGLRNYDYKTIWQSGSLPVYDNLVHSSSNNKETYDKVNGEKQEEQEQKEILGNIDEILELHEQQIYPLMLRHRHDLTSLFDEFTKQIDVSKRGDNKNRKTT